jgi:hypothetical protein
MHDAIVTNCCQANEQLCDSVDVEHVSHLTAQETENVIAHLGYKLYTTYDVTLTVTQRNNY